MTKENNITTGFYKYAGEWHGKVSVDWKVVWRGAGCNSSYAAAEQAINKAKEFEE